MEIAQLDLYTIPIQIRGGFEQRLLLATRLNDSPLHLPLRLFSRIGTGEVVTQNQLFAMERQHVYMANKLLIVTEPTTPELNTSNIYNLIVGTPNDDDLVMKIIDIYKNLQPDVAIRPNESTQLDRYGQELSKLFAYQLENFFINSTGELAKLLPTELENVMDFYLFGKLIEGIKEQMG